jgi:hypothetical protein
VPGLFPLAASAARPACRALSPKTASLRARMLGGSEAPPGRGFRSRKASSAAIVIRLVGALQGVTRSQAAPPRRRGARRKALARPAGLCRVFFPFPPSAPLTLRPLRPFRPGGHSALAAQAALAAPLRLLRLEKRAQTNKAPAPKPAGGRFQSQKALGPAIIEQSFAAMKAANLSPP